MRKNRTQSLGSNKLQFKKLPKKMIWMVVWLCLIFIIVQFVKLATVGRLGIQISAIQEKQQSLELENEIMRSEISKLLANPNMEAKIKEDKSLEVKEVKVISVIENTDDTEIYAQR